MVVHKWVTGIIFRGVGVRGNGGGVMRNGQTGWRGVVVIVVLGWLTAAVPARETGVDLSHFQGETGMPQANWNQLAAEGRTFAYIKATEGLLPPGNVDPA